MLDLSDLVKNFLTFVSKVVNGVVVGSLLDEVFINASRALEVGDLSVNLLTSFTIICVYYLGLHFIFY